MVQPGQTTRDEAAPERVTLTSRRPGARIHNSRIAR